MAFLYFSLTLEACLKLSSSGLGRYCDLIRSAGERVLCKVESSDLISDLVRLIVLSEYMFSISANLKGYFID